MNSANYNTATIKLISQDSWISPIDGDTYTADPWQFPTIDELQFTVSEEIDKGRVLPPKSQKSWSKTKSDGDIKFTPLKVWSVNRTNYLVTLSEEYRTYKTVAQSNGLATTNPKYKTACSGPLYNKYQYTTFFPAGDGLTNVNIFNRLKNYDVDERNPFPESDAINKAIESLKGKVVSELAAQLDALTTLAEGKESVETIVSLVSDAIGILRNWRKSIERFERLRESILRDRRKGYLDALKDLDKRFRDEWMRYRYGIMPLIMTVEDTLNLISDRAKVFKKVKSVEVINLSEESLPSPTANSFYYKMNGSVKVTAIGKARFKNQKERLINQVQLNPFATAWELIPYSFVVDWFLNIGDVIVAWSQGLVGDIYAKYCYSLKYEFQVRRYVKYSSVFTYPEYSIKYRHIPCSFARNVDVKLTTTIDQLCYIEDYKSYSRTLFEELDVELTINPTFLNWRRMLDTYALTFKSLKKTLIALRS